MIRNFLFLIISITLQFLVSYFLDLHWTVFALLTMILSVLAYFKFNFTKKTINIIAFLSVLLLWTGYSFYINIGNENILLLKINQLFHLPNTYLLPIIQGFFGRLIALLSSSVVLMFCNSPKE